jgi:YhcH/YjgK/YiaL family protein
MKKNFLFLLFLGFTVLSFAQNGYYTREYRDSKLKRKASSWLSKEAWRCGFTDANPHRSVNVTEFYEQYQKNPEQWQALFRWLAATNLLALPAGKHPIPGTTLVASVEDSENGPLETRNSESHYHHIDFQYVVWGIERFGIIDHLTSTPKDKWRPDVIHYDYDAQRARFYDSTPNEFFIFFPSDWHIAKVNNDTDDQKIRVIVIKVDYVD